MLTRADDSAKKFFCSYIAFVVVSEYLYKSTSMTSTRRKSAIWSFFSVDEDTKYALCNECKRRISRRGTTTKNYNITNLVSHLKTKHRELYSNWESLKAQEGEQDSEKPTTSKKTKQLTLEESGDRVRVWDINDQRA